MGLSETLVLGVHQHHLVVTILRNEREIDCLRGPRVVFISDQLRTGKVVLFMSVQLSCAVRLFCCLIKLFCPVTIDLANC